MPRAKLNGGVPRYVRALLASAPTGYRGVAVWLFRAARLLQPLYPDRDELATLLKAAVSDCGRDVSDLEVKEAVTNSARVHRQRRKEREKGLCWPKPNPGVAEILARNGPSFEELRRKSPAKFDCTRNSWTEQLIDILFPGNPLICAGTSARCFEIRPRVEWRGALARQNLIIPSPMSDTGRERTGTRHKPTHIGPRRFLAVQFTAAAWESISSAARTVHGNEERYYAAKRDEQAALLAHLGATTPLATVIQITRRSLCGWLYCHGQDESALLHTMLHAVTLGANKANWQKDHFVHMPDGGRRGGRFLEAVYLNPRPWAQEELPGLDFNLCACLGAEAQKTTTQHAPCVEPRIIYEK